MTYQFGEKPPDPKSKYNFGAQKVPYDSEQPKFSFRYFDDGHPRYSAKAITTLKEWGWVLRGLKHASGETWRDIKGNRNHFHAHEVTWSTTQEKGGFKHLAESFQRFPAFQFKVFDICRVFGFFDEKNIFQIVWIDRDHQIYPKRA